MTTPDAASVEGTFEYIEAKIRRDSKGTAFGGDFEWLCKWFLENAPRYRGQFDKVWLWKDWPDRWGTDAGIDIVARTRTGELWAIQAKADHPNRAIPKREIDSFLSESNRPQFAYRLLMATTDAIGAPARRTLHGQEKPVGLVLRGHFLTEEVQWPVQIGGTAARLPRWNARPHQATAVDATVDGFRDHDRGRLIMACGTGKTLTALWIAERLQSSLSLVLVPSLSLVQQNLAEWGRHAAEDFDTLIVCSDESVLQSKADTAIQSIADLGVKVTTDPAEIRHFLGRRRKRPAVVFATYQSSDRIAAAQARKRKPFDLVICDEAHRLAGHAEGLFATVLDGKKIKARKRLFMTATPRYIKDHVKRRAAEQEFELVSMDDEHVFGPEFHVLTFHEAISAEPPLLTDYQVVVIGVTDREAKAWAEQARLVRAAEGLSTDARTLAAQIGLAKAMKKYNLRKLITFHSSVAKAKRFVDATLRDSLPGVIPHLTRSARPTGKLWTKHISGHTPAGQRATMLKGLGDLPENTRGILSNCACLGEGVDVPVLDGVAFIDPKRSMVDIIQAVGRVIRKAEGKQIGTIVIPVFIDESEDADHVLSQSVFEPVWQVLKALRAHDRRLADELDQLRLSLGGRPKSGGRISLPDNIRLDVPRLLLRGFEQAFYVRTVEKTTDKPPLTIEQILTWADAHQWRTDHWPTRDSGPVVEATDEVWANIDAALKTGNRGLPGSSSLAQLLAEHRDVRNIADLPDLTIEQIVEWCDAHYERTKEWPMVVTGDVHGAKGETWLGIDHALRRGSRGLDGGSSLARLLSERRGVRNVRDLSPLSIEQIIRWADAYFVETKSWPKINSGAIPDSDGETWERIHGCLQSGSRGLSGGSSLAKLLAEKRGAKSTRTMPPLTEAQILACADSHYQRTGRWPTQDSGPVRESPDETWCGLNLALANGLRGLPGGSSLPKLLGRERNARNKSTLPQLSIDQVLIWIDEYHQETGSWPTLKSGEISNSGGETWTAISHALSRGSRGLVGGSSLAQLLEERRGVRNPSNAPALTIDVILQWADAHYEREGEWPKQRSGPVADAPNETWTGVDIALARGLRGMPGGSSLSRLLAEYRNVRNHRGLATLSVELILQWADTFHEQHEVWPKRDSGPICEAPGETWSGVNSALHNGRRGLPGGSSLAQLLAEHRRVRNERDLPELKVEVIVAWAMAHHARTGKWPQARSGEIEDAPHENWRKIDNALRLGLRQLPGGSSLAKLLADSRSTRKSF